MRHGPTFGRHVRVLRGQGKGDRIDQETRVTFWVVLSLFSWNGPSGSFAVPGLVLCEFAGPCPRDQKEFMFDSCWFSNVGGSTKRRRVQNHCVNLHHLT